jgi:magnesium-transporting ATPase (P-type)
MFLVRHPVDCVSTAAVALGSYFILYSSFIPISLIVSLEFVKVFQGAFMSADREMFCGLNQRGLECRTVSINEELGQVDYILTDKTGTLTCNRMEFRNIVVGADIYGEDLTLAAFDQIDYERLSTRYEVSHLEEHPFDPRRLNYDLGGGSLARRQMIELIFLAICTCHECVPSEGSDYEGPSPDEVALLKAAKRVGFRFVSCENKVIRVEYAGKARKF